MAFITKSKILHTNCRVFFQHCLSHLPRSDYIHALFTAILTGQYLLLRFPTLLKCSTLKMVIQAHCNGTITFSSEVYVGRSLSLEDPLQRFCAMWAYLNLVGALMWNLGICVVVRHAKHLMLYVWVGDRVCVL